MRNAFADELTVQSKRDNRIVLLSGDIGNRLFDNFKRNKPNKFYNCGIAESNMMSVASGLASYGFIPFVYTITPFITSRCYEQIKIGVSYHNLPVIIVGTGSGLSYSELGPTHHSFEDIGIIRILPNIQILTPGDSNELRLSIREILKNPKPTYIRIGKKGEKILPINENKFQIGKITKLRSGKHILILSMGNLSSEAIEACKELNKFNIKPSLYHVNTIKPFDENFLKRISRKYKIIITYEEHSKYGGLSSSVSELRSKYNLNFEHITMAMDDKYLHHSISQKNAREFFKISKNDLVNIVKKNNK